MTASASSPPRRGVARATPHPPSRRPGLAPGAGVTVPVASSSSGGGQGRRQAPLLPRRRPGRWPRSKRCAPATLSASPRQRGGLVPPRAGRFLRPVSLRCGLAADPAVCGRLRRRSDRPRCYECDVGNNDARVRLLELDPHADVMRDAVEALVGQVCELRAFTGRRCAGQGVEVYADQQGKLTPGMIGQGASGGDAGHEEGAGGGEA